MRTPEPGNHVNPITFNHPLIFNRSPIVNLWTSRHDAYFRYYFQIDTIPRPEFITHQRKHVYYYILAQMFKTAL